MNDKKTKEVDGRESVSMLPGVTVGVMIAVIAFVLSFDALRLVFVSSGINPLLSWGGPLCVDGTILLCTWATWGFRKGPWAGLVLFSLFSVTGNALHAWLNAGGMLPTWGAPAIMSIPPIALLYSTHLIVIIAGDRQDKLARTTGKAAGPDDGHAGPAAATPETAGTEPVRTENPRAIPTPTAGPEPGKATEPAPAGPLPVRPAGTGGSRRGQGKERGSGGYPVRPGPLMALRDVRDHDIRKGHEAHGPHGPHGPGPCGPGPCGPGPHGPETRDGSQGPAGPGGRGSCGPRRT